MRHEDESTRDGARVLLAGIRLINGLLGLVAPGLIARRFGSAPKENPAAIYALRLFGIRTILIAIDLLHRDGRTRAHAVRVAPLIHASDTMAAILARRSGRLPGQTGAAIVLISALNTLLAVVMQRPTRR
ncbi:MAG TPA: hypothetical protein VHL09_15855 [Dehalococcoidia bacterium]|nr:hypothetical protein [Dehalococcoidia bacterium]